MVELMLHRPLTTPEPDKKTGLNKNVAKSSLPSVSVCVPSSKDHVSEQLADCLAHILSSTYPKLEVIVHHEPLDYHPEVVQTYARKGVRFIPHDEAQTDHRQHLLNEASGNLVFFVDPETQLEPETIGDMVHGFLGQSSQIAEA
jgi:cellulose synthase/poly-beta-1,6-N-acetylglucosamine synthase-like glycosyltransferase